MKIILWKFQVFM